MPDFMVPYHCPVTGKYWDAGKALEEFDGEADMVKVRTVLGLPEVDGSTGEGFTDVAVNEAYNTFLEWLEGKDDGADSGQSFVPLTVSRPASAPSNCCP